MNRASFLTLTLVSFILSVTAVGCIKKGPKSPTPIPGIARPLPGSGQPTGPTGEPGVRLPGDTAVNPKGLPTDPNTGGTQLGERPEEGNYYLDREVFKEQTVYFGFDSSAVKPEEKSKIDAVAAYLKTHPTCKVKIEGHCDERGTDGYNLSLGERRALSAREALIATGVPGENVNTITFGESKPAVLGHDETAWAKNRRGEFVLLTPKTQ